MPLEDLRHYREVVWQPAVVGVDERGDPPPHHLKAGIPRGRHPGVLLPDVANPLADPGQYLLSPVRRSVVHHDQLEVAKRLRQHAGHSAPDRFPALIGRQDHRHGRGAHRSLLDRVHERERVRSARRRRPLPLRWGCGTHTLHCSFRKDRQGASATRVSPQVTVQALNDVPRPAVQIPSG